MWTLDHGEMCSFTRKVIDAFHQFITRVLVAVGEQVLNDPEKSIRISSQAF